MREVTSKPDGSAAYTTSFRRGARLAKRGLRAATPSIVAAAIERADYRRRRLITRNPRTFNEKIFYKMLRDHRPLLTTFADKVAVRAYVSDRVGAQVLPNLVGVFEHPGDLLRATFPDQFALKATHASGGVVLVSLTAPTDARLPDPRTAWPRAEVRPEHLDRRRLVELCSAWLGRTYGGGAYREWAYVDVPPRILVEELLRDDNGIPADFKLFVFNGRCRLIQVDSSRFGTHRQNFFDREWTPLAVELAAPPADATPERPRALEQMIEISERLGAETDFVRVDLYEIDGRVIFGEMTSYVLGGRYKFRPAQFELEVGSWWDLPRRYR